MADVRVAVLGVSGWMGRVHTMASQTFPHFMGTEGGTAGEVALVAQNAGTAAELGFPAPEARVLQSGQAAVQDREIDLIDMCLPDSLHDEVARASLLAGKHVYCEKPLADTAAQARELADISKAKGLTTRVGHAFARNPVHDPAKENIEAAEVIRPVTTGQKKWPCFKAGHRICRIVDACMEFSRLGRWVAITRSP